MTRRRGGRNKGEFLLRLIIELSMGCEMSSSPLEEVQTSLVSCYPEDTFNEPMNSVDG